MRYRPLTRCAALLALMLLLSLAAAPSAAQQAETNALRPDRPNIILIMADDMGWGWMDFPMRLGEGPDAADIMYPGQSMWQTPNLAAMAENGLVFTRMYSQSAVCSPTRASCLTGRSPERTGVTFANTGRMENGEVTLAEYAQALGYTTGMFGKWHLGVFSREVRDANRGGRPNAHQHYSTPLMNGFDVMYATESKTSTFDPGVSGLTTDTRYWTGPGAFIPLDAEELRGDDSAIIVREAIDFMQQAVDNDQPFFTVIWFHTPHLPVNLPGNEEVNTPAAFAFAMEDMDTAIGQVRDALREMGVDENTMICFTSDNGPENNYDYFDPLRGRKRDLFEGGVRVPGIIEWPQRIAPGVTHTPMVTTDYLPTILDIWGIDPVDDRPFDGTSMTQTLFEDRDAPREAPIYFNMRGRLLSIIGGPAGRYKLISTDGGESWALYDIVIDFDENDPLTTTATLADAPAEVQALYNELLQQYTDWQVSVDQSLVTDRSYGDYEHGIARIETIMVSLDTPASLAPGVSQSNRVMLYLEQHHAVFRPEMLPESDIDGNRCVSSYLLHFDTGRDGGAAYFEFAFDRPILMVLTDPEDLIATDSLSYGDITFGTDNLRGLEENDSIELVNPTTLRILVNVDADDLDQIRILTLSPLNQVAQP